MAFVNTIAATLGCLTTPDTVALGNSELGASRYRWNNARRRLEVGDASLQDPSWDVSIHNERALMALKGLWTNVHGDNLSSVMHQLLEAHSRGEILKPDTSSF